MLNTYARPTLIEVVAPYCGECRAMRPDLDAVAAGFDDVDLVVLDATTEPETVSELRIFGTPTFIAVRDGREIARFVGRRTRAELRDLFTALAEGDPSTVDKTTSGDRLVGTVAGVGLIGVGALLGPAWPLVVAGAGVIAYMSLPHIRTLLRR